jgi:mannose-6-phosphate isomerase-like protein (cupin superfamily)
MINAMKLSMILLLLTPLVAADPAGFAMWTGKELKGYEKKLAPKIDAKKFASEPLGKFGNHALQIAHREGSGEGELHETQADLFIVQTGEATLVVGGTIPGSKTTAPNEVRGPSVQGGEKKKLGPGAVVHIPANTPHQLLVDSGKQFTYAIMKIDSK